MERKTNPNLPFGPVNSKKGRINRSEAVYLACGSETGQCKLVSYADLNVYGWDLGLPAKTEISCDIARCIMRYHAIS